MIRYLKNRFHAYIQGIMAENVSAIAELAAMHVPEPDILDMASKVQLQMDTDPIAERVVDLIKRTDHAVEYESLAECIDISELAGQFTVHDIAGEVDCQWVAEHLPVSDIAENFAVNELADYIDLEALASAFSADDLADKLAGGLDYKCLAAAILKELRPVEVRPSA